jgi:hypothetical protein
LNKENSMRSSVRFAALSVISLGMLAGSAEAAPIGLRDRPAEPISATRVDLVTQCWRTPSGRHRCRTVYVNPAQSWDPNRYPVGSTEWWRAMDRRGSGGYRQ